MAGNNHVVVHFADGRLLKGTTIDFNVMQPKFHVAPLAGGPVVPVLSSEMKALFFVKSLQGRTHPVPSSAGFEAHKTPHSQGKKVAVRFKDGEILCGYTLTFVPGRPGFFMFPADADANNLRIYVVQSSTVEVRTGTDAEALAQRMAAEIPGRTAKG